MIKVGDWSVCVEYFVSIVCGITFASALRDSIQFLFGLRIPCYDLSISGQSLALQ